MCPLHVNVVQAHLVQARWWGAYWLFAMCVLFSGCSEATKLPETEQASIDGTLVKDGQPVALDTSVVFSCKDHAAIAGGTVDSLGKFILTAQQPQIGIPVGRYNVMFRPPQPPTLVEGTPEYRAAMSGKSPVAPASKEIPKRLQAFDTSGIVVEVKGGDNHFDFDIAKLSKGSK